MKTIVSSVAYAFNRNIAHTVALAANPCPYLEDSKPTKLKTREITTQEIPT